MIYFNKTKILAGLLLSLNGFLHASDNAPTLQDPLKVPKALAQMTDACTRALENAGLTYIKDSQPLLNSSIAIGLDENALRDGGSITTRLTRLEANQTDFATAINQIKDALANMLYESRANMNMLIEQINDLTERLTILQASQDSYGTFTRSILDPNIIQEDPLDVARRERVKFLPDPIPATPLPYTEEQLSKKEKSDPVSDLLTSTIQDSSISNPPSTDQHTEESKS